jgi:hypothetical protein
MGRGTRVYASFMEKCQKRVSVMDRANPTVQLLGDLVGLTAGDLYPLGVDRDYGNREGS